MDPRGFDEACRLPPLPEGAARTFGSSPAHPSFTIHCLHRRRADELSRPGSKNPAMRRRPCLTASATTGFAPPEPCQRSSGRPASAGSNPGPGARLLARAPAGTKAVGTGTGGERRPPDHPVADRGRGEIRPGGERLEAGRGHHLRLPGDVVQPAAVGVDRYGAVARPGPHPRRRAPAAVPSPARVRDSPSGLWSRDARAVRSLRGPRRVPVARSALPRGVDPGSPGPRRGGLPANTPPRAPNPPGAINRGYRFRSGCASAGTRSTGGKRRSPAKPPVPSSRRPDGPPSRRSSRPPAPYESREAEDRTVVVPRMRARDVRADVAELVEVGDVDQTASRKRESPHLGAGLGKRAGLASCVSRVTMAASPSEVNLASAIPAGWRIVEESGGWETEKKMFS